MTVAPRTPPLSFSTIDEAISAVRAGGMRLSTGRRLILEVLFAAEGPVSAVHIAETLDIDAPSVYRNLEVLERHGMIRHVHLGHGPGLYVLVGRHEVEYLYCDRCAKVTPVTPEQLDPLREHLKASFGYEVRFTHFALVGLCGQCARPDHSRRADGADHPHHAAGADHSPDAGGPHEHMHSHGDRVHSHPHVHTGDAGHHHH